MRLERLVIVFGDYEFQDVICYTVLIDMHTCFVVLSRNYGLNVSLKSEKPFRKVGFGTSPAFVSTFKRHLSTERTFKFNKLKRAMHIHT